MRYILYLLDYATLAWVLAVCLLALLGTGSLRALRAMFLREASLAAAQARGASQPGRRSPSPPCWRD